MLDHLDDPEAPPFGAEFRAGVTRQASSTRRRRRMTVASILALPLLGVLGGAVYFNGQTNELDRVEIAGLGATDQPDGADFGAADADIAGDAPVAPLSQAMNILLVGTDRDNPGVPEADGTGRADAIAVVRIDPGAERIALLSIPRDLWVEPGDGIRGGRINSLLDPNRSQLVAAVEEVVGLSLDHYIEIDFKGFASLVDLAGGVRVPFDLPLRDTASGFETSLGCQTLDGASSLAYLRSRRLVVANLDVPADAGDLGRVARREDFAQRAYRAILTSDYSITDEARIISNVLDDITVDSGLDARGLRSLLATAQAIGPDGLENIHAVWVPTERTDGSAVLGVDPASLAEARARLVSGDAPTIDDDPTAAQPYVPADDPTC